MQATTTQARPDAAWDVHPSVAPDLFIGSDRPPLKTAGPTGERPFFVSFLFILLV
jgi:hypothetical protein